MNQQACHFKKLIRVIGKDLYMRFEDKIPKMA